MVRIFGYELFGQNKDTSSSQKDQKPETDKERIAKEVAEANEEAEGKRAAGNGKWN